MQKTVPVVILAQPQLGENIGAAARAMANFGLSDLRLVRPRERWPNKKAEAMAANAAHIIAFAHVFQSVAEAGKDLRFLLAATARDRKVAKPVLTPVEAAKRLRSVASRGLATGLLFGPERAGLENDDLSLADALVTIPTAPDYASLNLAQAVLLLGYEWFRAGDKMPAERIDHGVGKPAQREELFGLFHHLEGELDDAGFLYPPHKKPAMVRNLRAILHRARLTDQEVRTLRGVVAALVRSKERKKRTAKP
ncbi:MAG: RNA methyltransferase [Alphaproteobacteria bacterium]